MKKFLLGLLLIVSTFAGAQQSLWTTRAPSATSITSAAFPLVAPGGSAAAPSYGTSVSGSPGLFFPVAGNMTAIATASGLSRFSFDATSIRLCATCLIGWGSNSNDVTGTANDTILQRDGANILALANAANAQEFRVYGNTTGPKYVSFKHDGTNAIEDNHGSFTVCANVCSAFIIGSGSHAGGLQVRMLQTTVPTITTNGGTGPACVGSDTAMVCTIGTAPPAAATFTVTFNGTYASAPSCVAIRGTTGATPLVQGVVAGTTTLVVNLSANLVASEKYNIQCFGIS